MICNRIQIAEVFGVAPTTIDGWVRSGMPIQLANGGSKGNQYSAPACIQWRIARESGGANIDYHEERARLTKAQADKAEMDALVQSGEMAPIGEVIAHWTAKAVAFKSRLLAMPGKITPQVRAALNEAEASEILESELLEALAEIDGDGLPDTVRSRRARAARGAKAAAEVNG